MAVFSDAEKLKIQKAIEAAEKFTDGQIRVCIEKTCNENVLDRATKYFYQLNMHKTKLRHGVLIYVATVDRKFAIIDDAGINKVVEESFWDDTKTKMLQHFKFGEIVNGIVSGIESAGHQLQKFFPSNVNSNELTNEIAFMHGK